MDINLLVTIQITYRLGGVLNPEAIADIPSHKPGFSGLVVRQDSYVHSFEVEGIRGQSEVSLVGHGRGGFLSGFGFGVETYVQRMDIAFLDIVRDDYVSSRSSDRSLPFERLQISGDNLDILLGISHDNRRRWEQLEESLGRFGYGGMEIMLDGLSLQLGGIHGQGSRMPWLAVA